MRNRAVAEPDKMRSEDDIIGAWQHDGGDGGDSERGGGRQWASVPPYPFDTSLQYQRFRPQEILSIGELQRPAHGLFIQLLGFLLSIQVFCYHALPESLWDTS